LFSDSDVLFLTIKKFPVTDVLHVAILARMRAARFDPLDNFSAPVRPLLDQMQLGELDFESSRYGGFAFHLFVAQRAFGSADESMQPTAAFGSGCGVKGGCFVEDF
jgi:hypothetical protein